KGRAEMAGYLFNRRTGELWWKKKAEATEQSGFLLTAMAGGMAGSDFLQQDTLNFCGVQVAETLPEWPEGSYQGREGVLCHAAPGLDPARIDKIVLRRPIDGRRMTVAGSVIDFEKLQETFAACFRDKGYEVEKKGLLDLDDEAIVSADEKMIMSWKSGSDRYIVLPVVNDYMPLLMGMTRCEMTVYLFDTETGKLLWEGSSMNMRESGLFFGVKEFFPKHSQKK
ncbi:MAG: hypothetical protein WCN95_12775, partial [bacterium]